VAGIKQQVTLHRMTNNRRENSSTSHMPVLAEYDSGLMIITQKRSSSR